MLLSPWSYRGNAASRLLKWYSLYTHPLPKWTLPELFSSWSSNRNQWECKQISRGETVIPPARRVMISWSSSMHLYSYATYICFSPCSLQQWRDSTLHTLMTIYGVSLSFSSNRHSEGKYITTSHHYINDGSQRNILLWGRSCADKIQISGQTAKKVFPRVCLSSWDWHMLFPSSYEQSWSWRDSCPHRDMELFLLRARKIRAQGPNFLNNQLIIQIQISWLLKINWLICRSL